MIVNLTPHAIVVGAITIPPSGGVARVDVVLSNVGYVDGIPLVSGRYGAVSGLPDPVPGTTYIVSSMVRLASPCRDDIVSPAEMVRDAAGRIIGCASFEVNPC